MVDMPAKYDVVVAGAGPAGLAAALMAARTGMATLLVERRETIGGSVRAAMHTAICGLYGDHSESYDDTLNGGIQRQVATRLHELSPDVSCLSHRGPVRVLPFRRDVFVDCWMSLLKAEESLDLRLSTEVVKVQRRGAQIESITLSSEENVVAESVIDATGTCAVAQMADADVMSDEPGQRQLAGYAIRYGGLGGERSRLQLEVPYCLGHAARRGDVPQAAKYTTFAPAPEPGVGVCKVAVPLKLCQRGSAVAEYVGSVERILEDNVQRLSRDQIAATSPGVVYRDGPRIRGERILDRATVLNAAKHGGVRAAWPIEFWHPETGPHYEYLPEGEYYEIAAEALRSVDVDNLVCAGRCISATSEAAASLRVAGTCIALGEMAGRMVRHV